MFSKFHAVVIILQLVVSMAAMTLIPHLSLRRFFFLSSYFSS